MVNLGNKIHINTYTHKYLWENRRLRMKVIIKQQVGYRLITIVRSSEQNDSSCTPIRICATSFHCAGQSLANTAHTNTTHKLYTFGFYCPLQVSAMYIDHHQVEYRYRRKSLCCSSFPSVPVLHLMVVNIQGYS
jgi:hypothetical protein